MSISTQVVTIIHRACLFSARERKREERLKRGRRKKFKKIILCLDHCEGRERALFLSLPPKCCKTNRLLLDDAALAGYSHQVFELQDP